jgi:hypothetical protein
MGRGPNYTVVPQDWDNLEYIISDLSRILSAQLDESGPISSYILANGTRAFTGNQSMGSKKLTNVLDPTANQDAATKVYVDSAITGIGIGNYLPLAGGTMTGQIVSTLAIGTSPFAVTSTTVNTNLNADLWDGYQFSDYLNQAAKTTSSPVFAGLTLDSLSGVLKATSGVVSAATAGTDYQYGLLTTGRLPFATGTPATLTDTSKLAYSTTTNTLTMNTGQLAITGTSKVDGSRSNAIDVITATGGIGSGETGIGYAGGGYSLTGGLGGSGTSTLGGTGGSFLFTGGSGGASGTGTAGDGGNFAAIGGFIGSPGSGGSAGNVYLGRTAAGVERGSVYIQSLSGLLKGTSGVVSAITDNSANWNTAYTDRLKWDGGATDLVVATGRTSLGLGVADTPSFTGLISGIDAATNTAGTLKLWSAGANNYSTLFTAGTQTADATYTLPTAMPTSVSKFLQSTTGGVLSWESVAAPLSFGTTTQIPYMNVAGTDFLYSANHTFDGTNITLLGDYNFGGTAARQILHGRATSGAGQNFTVTAGGSQATPGAGNYAGGDLKISSGISSGSGNSKISFYVARTGNANAGENTPTEVMRLSPGLYSSPNAGRARLVISDDPAFTQDNLNNNAFQALANSVTGFKLYSASDTAATAPLNLLIKSRGTQPSPTGVVTGDRLGSFNFQGLDATAGTIRTAARMRVECMGTIGSNRVPGKIIFSTVTDASTGVDTDAFVIDDAQNAYVLTGLRVGSLTVAPTVALDVTGAGLIANDTTTVTTLKASKNVATVSADIAVANFIQDSATGACEVLRLQQDDTSEEFIDFVGTDGGATGADSGASVIVALSGTKYKLKLYALS